MDEIFIAARPLHLSGGKVVMPGERWFPTKPLHPTTARSLIRRGMIERVWVEPPKKRGRPPKAKVEVIV